MARQLNPWTRRRITAWSLFAAALLIAGQHLLAHAGWRPLPFSMGWQDILVGYPMAVGLAIAGGMLLPAHPAK